VNGKIINPKVELGFAVIERLWKKGDQVILELPMPTRLNSCDKRVEENHDRISFTRGPFVLCAEEVDNEGATQRFFLTSKSPLEQVKLSKVKLPSGSFFQVKSKAYALLANGKSEIRN
ncbi:MAG: hypothetical protein ACKVJ1_08125, partial [Verrucomicrobiia bacterium]